MSHREKLKQIILAECADARLESEDDYNAEFADVGIDSLDIMAILLKVQGEFGVEIADDVVDELVSVSDIEKLLN